MNVTQVDNELCINIDLCVTAKNKVSVLLDIIKHKVVACIRQASKA